jgi:hypothetical protein
MVVTENFTVPIGYLSSFLAEHVDQRVVIKEVTESDVKFNITCEYTEPELHMFHLRKFVESGDATPEEQNAAEYAIGAIKTLMDMGVLK